MAERYRLIESWKEADLLDLPGQETEYYEYKSSRATVQQLKEKIPVAASAFWNSGGGIFVSGVDGNGKVDGGIPETIGRQTIRDWTDQVIASVEPPGPYTIRTIKGQNSGSLISANCVVLAISFGTSYLGPHMAPDGKYYVRAGAHSGPASHYIVEAIRARRGLQNPVLRGTLRFHPQKPETIQLVVLNLTNAPALNVTLTFEPFPKAYAEHRADRFPLNVSVISYEQPFMMDISSWHFTSEFFGDEPVELKITYSDLADRTFSESQTIHPNLSLGPLLKMGHEVSEEIHKELAVLGKEMQQLRQVAESLFKFLIEKNGNDKVDR